MQNSKIVAGALFDFVGMLTTLAEPLTVWSGAEPHIILDKLQTWAAERGLSLSAPYVEGWVKELNQPVVQPFEAKLSEADHMRLAQMVEGQVNRIVLSTDGRARMRDGGSSGYDVGMVRKEYVDGQFSTVGVHNLVLELIRSMGIVPEERMDSIMEFELLVHPRIGNLLSVSYIDPNPIEIPTVVVGEFELMARPMQVSRDRLVTEPEGAPNAGQ